jgi:hypothetical protein
MASDQDSSRDQIVVAGAHLVVARTISESYSLEHKIVQTEYSESVVRAQVGVARARFTWPVVAVMGGTSLAAIAVAWASVALNFTNGLYVAGALMAPAGIGGLLKMLGVGPDGAKPQS